MVLYGGTRKNRQFGKPSIREKHGVTHDRRAAPYHNFELNPKFYKKTLDASNRAARGHQTSETEVGSSLECLAGFRNDLTLSFEI